MYMYTNKSFFLIQEEPVPGLLLPLEICLLGGEGCSPDTSVVEEGHLLSALCLFPGESDGCLGHLQKLTTQAWLPYTKLMEGMTEKVYKKCN